MTNEAKPKKGTRAKKTVASGGRATQGTAKEAAEMRRKIFINAYLANGHNATQAAIEAGFSKPTAHVKGSQLMAEPEVKRALEVRMAELVKRYELTTDMVVRSLVQALRFDPRNLCDQDGKPIPVTKLDDDTAAALMSMETVQKGGDEAPVIIHKFRWESKAAAREQAMKHLGMFEKDNKQRTDPFADFLASMRSSLPVVRE